ncbi:chromate transporter [Rhodopila sp.]|uniref:chromate transporter n=1 Tax=Rhodopila sp. TaxID=2480087 RepID=UPI003D0A8AFD
MGDTAFANVFAISHAAPGPNIIMVSLIGWQLAGLAGLAVATLAIMLPSCTLASVTARMIGRWSGHWRIELLKRALVPVALGLMLASGVAMMRTADHDMLTVAISLATAGFVKVSACNPLWALAGATLVNVVAPHL